MMEDKQFTNTEPGTFDTFVPNLPFTEAFNRRAFYVTLQGRCAMKKQRIIFIYILLVGRRYLRTSV
jgi:hypothetical protein